MRNALLAAVAVAALAFPGLGATATNKTHAATAARASQAKALPRPVHQMLGVQLPFIKTGPKVGQGYVLRHKRSPRPQGSLGYATDSGDPNNIDNLTYGNADQIPPKALAGLPTVMTTNTNYAIFWIPNGYRTASNYISVISQYFNDVAHDSYGNGNVDSPSVQYSGAHDGEIFYDSTWGGYAIDTNPFPKSGCMGSYTAFASSAGLAKGHLAMQGLTNCLTDAQLQTEVKRFADAQGWDHGAETEFFMYTPHNVGSCFYADGKVKEPDGSSGPNLDNPCSYDYYCAYHSEFGTTPSTEYIYANMPFPNQAFKVQGGNLYKSVCDAGEHPNGTGSEENGTDPNGPTDADAADQVINVTSHEHQESVTDPTGYGWWVDTYLGVDENGNPIPDPYIGYENGDLCAWHWASDGSDYAGNASNNSFYTNTINGHKYFLQGEWSNADATDVGYSGCVWGYSIDQPAYTADTNTLTGPDNPGAGNTLTLTAGTWTGTRGVYSYVWLRCSPDAFGVARRHLLPSPTQLKAKNFALGNGCDLAALDFSSDSTDTYTLTSADVSNVIIGAIYKDNGSGDDTGEYAGGDATPTQILITGEPESNHDMQLSPTTGLVPGSKLTLNLGTWSNTPLTYSVQWQRCNDGAPESCTTFKTVKVTAAKTGTTSTSYTLVATDVRSAFRAVVTGSNKVGTSNYAETTDLTDAAAGYPTNSGGDNAPSWGSDSPVVGTADVLTLNKAGWTVPTGAPITGWAVTVDRCPLLTDPITIPDYADCELSATLTAAASANTVSFKPTPLDVGQTLVAFVTPKNKFGTADPYSVFTMNTVGGNPVNTLAPAWEQTTTASGPGTCPQVGDIACVKVTLDLGTWSPTATQYRYSIYACGAPDDTTTCQKLTTLRTDGANTSVDWKGTDGHGVDNFGGEYFLRAAVQAINANGYSNDVTWSSNAVDVDGA